MRFSVPFVPLLAVVTATFATLVARQDGIPSCASPCLTSVNSQECSATDLTCLCEDPTYIDSVYSCVSSSCSGSDVQTAEGLAQQLCLSAGVTLNLTSITAQPSSTSTSAPISTHTSSSVTTSSTSGSAATPAAPTRTSGASMTGGISVLTGALAVLAVAAGL